LNGKKALLNREQKLYHELNEYIEINRPKIIIFDPVVRFFDGDENNSQDATRFVELLEEIKNKGITVLFAHHTSKSGADSISQHASRGSSAFVDGARWQMVLKKLSKGQIYKFEDGETIPKEEIWRYAIAEITKCNSFRPELNEFAFERQSGGVLELIPYTINE